MKLPFSNNEHKTREQPDKTPVLLEITPPRVGERNLLAVENMLGSVTAPEPFSLELAGDADRVAVMARCHDEDVVRGQLAVHYPQSRTRGVAPEDDPLRLEEGEQAYTAVLRSSGPEYVPLRTFQDRDLTDPGSDPLLAPLGALSGLNPGERVVTRMRMRSLGPDWAVHHQRLAHERPATPPPTQSTQPGAPSSAEPIRMAVLGVVALLGLKAYNWVQADETWKAVLMGIGLVALLIAVGYVKARFFKPQRSYPPALVAEKVSRIAFEADVQVTVIVPEAGGEPRAGIIMKRVAAAYRHYDNPSGASFIVGELVPVDVMDTGLGPEPPGLFGRRSVIGVREAAALWHPPAPADDTPSVERSGPRTLAPSARSFRSGAPVGETTAGMPFPIHFPDDLLRRHHLYVARTRMGKSTLMHHVIAHKMREKAAGRNPDAIVVVDPHADLVKSLLEHVPAELIPQVRLIDLADRRGAPGINLIDSRIFTDRDRTADAVVRIARGIWEQWGPRMQSILEQTVKTLHEANSHPETNDDEQFTILDGLRLIAENDKFRTGVLKRVSDPYILEWWARDFGGWNPQYRAEALAPVQTRLSYYASSKKARAILGQPRSTIDIRQTVLDGGILLVSTNQGAVGRDVAALVGSSILNLVDAVIREQGDLPSEQRRGALVVVDEMQTMPGVDYEAMLSELGKFGASFILATQSLGKLDELSPTMRDTVLANVGCLAVFQVAGNDARQLVYELGRDRVCEEDIVSLGVHECYVRATVGSRREPAYSITVLAPQPGDPDTADRIRAEAAAYLTTDEEIAAQMAENQRRAEEFRNSVKDIRDGRSTPGNQQKDAPRDLERDKQRSKHFQPPTARTGQDTPNEEDEG